ncbi:MAG: CRISPR-associated protein [Desulfotomaculales bacterium]
MSYDLYVALGGLSQQDAEAIVNGHYRGVEITDIAARIRLLAGVAARSEDVKKNAVNGYKNLVYARRPPKSRYAKELIAAEYNRLEALGLLKPTVPDMQAFPPGSWFLQFTFTLAKPWLSRDDDPFYVAEGVNPVRKDKVFKVPLASAAGWKGLLRWTAMHTELVEKRDQLDDDTFAEKRFQQTLLFGDEKGEEPGTTKDFAAYLDELGGKEARRLYERKVREHFGVGEGEALPHHGGRLFFYPTFFDLIDVEVINPHSRKTRAGTRPIYLECVPATAQGTFSLLYVPFDLIGEGRQAIVDEARADLLLVAEAVSAMMLVYGFSAKRTSSYGAAEDEVTGAVTTRAGEKPVIRLSRLREDMTDVQF